jgi:hypothetical protein
MEESGNMFMPQSGTNLTTFNPYAVPYQAKVTELVRKDWDYSNGNLEILLSGSYGSAKSILMAHLAITHCLFYPKSVAMMARKSMPDLRATIFKEILEHLDCDGMVEGVDYTINHTSATILFSNGSTIESISWADKKYKKGRSRKISFLVFEELTENNEDDKEAFMTLKARLRRLPHVSENVLIAATNPDAPSHWVYKYFFEEKQDTKFVFKSITTDNPFLDPVYIEQLKRDLDPRAIQRYIYGEWIELQKEQVYYNYSTEINLKKDFTLLKREPIIITHDFNIGHNKPMSACAMVRRVGVYHAFKSFHVEGARTLDIMEEIGSSGVLDNDSHIIVYGDASGRNNDTRSIKTDYDIIQHYLSNYRTKDGRSISFELRVPRANPPIRRRHNIVNAHFMNELKEIRLLVYDKWLDEGFRLTSFKKNGDMTEDDSLPQQHITTAIGYVLDYDKYKTTSPSRSIQL